MFGLLDVLDVGAGLRVGLVAGLAGAAVCLAGCWIVTEAGPAGPGSLAAALAPWWSNWEVALAGFASSGFLFGIGAATRPERKRNG